MKTPTAKKKKQKRWKKLIKESGMYFESVMEEYWTGMVFWI